MAGPVPTYLDTQAAAQTAFSVPFGLLTLVNSSIAMARAAGEFNTTVDCSLFVSSDVSNLRVYLDSLGYKVEYAVDSGQKGLLIDWGSPLGVEGASQPVTQGTMPWITEEQPATDGNIATVVVGTSSTQLLAANPARKGAVIQCVTSPLYVITSSSPASIGSYTYYVLKLNALELNGTYRGPISAVVPSGTASVQVTEQV